MATTLISGYLCQTSRVQERSMFTFGKQTSAVASVQGDETLINLSIYFSTTQINDQTRAAFSLGSWCETRSSAGGTG